MGIGVKKFFQDEWPLRRRPNPVSSWHAGNLSADDEHTFFVFVRDQQNTYGLRGCRHAVIISRPVVWVAGFVLRLSRLGPIRW